MPKKKDRFCVTVSGEFFPERYPAQRSPRWSRGDEDPLATEMRLFGACQRWAYRRLREGMGKDAIKKAGQALFGLNSRYVDDARLKAQALLEAQTEQLEREIEETERKLSRARKRLGHTMKKLAKLEKKGEQGAEKLQLAVKGRRSRVGALEKKLGELRKHKEAGSLPKVVFGGRDLWRRVCRGRASREAWRAARRNRLYALGNPNMKVTCREGAFSLAVTLSHLSEPMGVDRRGRPVMSRAPRVEGRLWLPEKHRDMVRIWVASRLPYTAELLRGVDGRYRVHLTMDLGEVPRPDGRRGCLAVDTNPDGVALCNVSREGQPEPWPEGFSIPQPGNLGKYEGEFRVVQHPSGFLSLHIPDLAYASGFRRSYLIGVLAKVVVETALRLEKPLALENRDFGKDRLDTNPAWNRLASGFPYAKMIASVMRGSSPRGPRRTARPAPRTIQWAGLAIGRRAMGYRERITRSIRQRVAAIKACRIPKVHGAAPGEGAGMNRRIQACLTKLERRMPYWSALTRFQQEARDSVWRDFKRLAGMLRRLRLAGIG